MELCKGLGSTEMMAGATQTYRDCNNYGSVGIPLVKTNCMEAEFETTDELSYNCQGEICFTGLTLMLGYYNMPLETDEIIRNHPDGRKWLHTGDLGYMTEDGIIFVTGRIKRIVMAKGSDGQVTKFFPDRIEKTISRHPAVELCCVIGISDKDRINCPKAIVVSKSKSDEEASIKIEILEICKQNLPEHMVPEEIEFVNNMPRTERGKIDYRALEKDCQNSVRK